MVYKIGLVSTNGTGKTTLAVMVESELKKREIEAHSLREKATQAMENGLPINEGTTLEAQMWILHTQFAEELKYTSKRTIPVNYEVIICDRGPDNYCYLKHSFGENKPALGMTLNHMEQFPYSQLYLLPIVNADLTPGTGARTTTIGFREKMDQEIREFLQQYNLSHIELPIPKDDDPLRNEWVKIVVNQTMKDLKKPERYFMT